MQVTLLIELLNSAATGPARTGANSQRINVGIRLGPDALFIHSFESCFSVCYTVIINSIRDKLIFHLTIHIGFFKLWHGITE